MTMEHDADRGDIWANNFQSISQLLRSGFPTFLNGSLAEANALRRFCQSEHAVVVGDRTLTVRLTVTSE